MEYKQCTEISYLEFTSLYIHTECNLLQIKCVLIPFKATSHMTKGTILLQFPINSPYNTECAVVVFQQ
jgi:hypothetical protein